jgi:hypothetical protein
MGPVPFDDGKHRVGCPPPLFGALPKRWSSATYLTQAGGDAGHLLHWGKSRRMVIPYAVYDATP